MRNIFSVGNSFALANPDSKMFDIMGHLVAKNYNSIDNKSTLGSGAFFVSMKANLLLTGLPRLILR